MYFPRLLIPLAAVVTPLVDLGFALVTLVALLWWYHVVPGAAIVWLPALIALAVVAMTVGLIRSEATSDLRTLTATGATSTTRRKLSAVTTGVLAALGVVLGTAGAYIALGAGGVANLLPLPYRDLAIIALGTPLCAAAAGWLMAGREPAAIARRPIA